jgi:tRNA(Ile)-lysidine synthase
MSPLNWFINSTQIFGVEFFAVNIEHGIRGEASRNDSLFVEDFCIKNGVRLESFKVDALGFAKEKGLTVEQAARELRYNCFESLISGLKCNKVATAHHADDNAETLLMRAFRGTGVRGLAGISETREGKYIRPFLQVSREDIEEYVDENRIPYLED